ncbi:chitinase [Ophiocordyceps camponoti-floridani]|uniref:chitinase n=1 Tax=Ophiocordyceps camponoti-floridani TaxID=2030778 RepID=A0A8H4Q8W7_9HYPO|nr:chitinase [Ophiocordyceps camponoti-floridani]
MMNRIFSLAGLVLATAGVTLGAEPIIYGYLEAPNIDLKADYSKYNHIGLVFGVVNEDATFTFKNETGINDLVNKVHEKSGKVLAGLGGSGGSDNFSSIVADEKLRNDFSQHISDYIREMNLDGVDLDWVYVGRDISGCATVDVANDGKNYLSFVEGLRKKLDDDFGPRKKLIAMGVRVFPFEGPDGPMKDMSEFAKVVDFANLFSWDLNGPWDNTTGPLAPLDLPRGQGEQISSTSAIDAWVDAKWPANQLTIGIPLYGRSTQALENMLLDRENQYQPISHDAPVGDADDEPRRSPCTGKTSTTGMWKWSNLVKQGVLKSPLEAEEPWVRQVDERTKTPWLFNRDTKVFLSMDDPDSVKAKIEVAKKRGLAGVNAFTIDQDTGNQDMTNAIVEAWKK